MEHWVPDESSSSCQDPSCQKEFSFLVRRHHCRECGRLFCGECYDHWILREGDSQMVPVCFACYLELTHLDGERWSTYGSKNGLPVVLLNGAMGSRAFLRPQAEALAQEGCYVVVLEYPGLGSREREVMSEAAVLEAVRDAVHEADPLTHRAHIVGYSMGGFVAMKFLKSHPDAVRSLVVGGCSHIPSRAFLTMAGLAYLVVGRETMWGLIESEMLKQKVREEDVEAMKRAGLQFRRWPQCISVMFEQVAGSYLETLSSRSPILLFTGSEDSHNAPTHDTFALALGLHEDNEDHIIAGATHENLFASRFGEVMRLALPFMRKHNVARQ